MNGQLNIRCVVGFLEGMYYVGKRPSLAEVPDITGHLLRKGMVEGTQTEIEVLVHTHIGALSLLWDTPLERGNITAASVNKAKGLNRMIEERTVNIWHDGQEVIRVLALENDMIRVFFALETPDPHRWADIPATTYLRITR